MIQPTDEQAMDVEAMRRVLCVLRDHKVAPPHGFQFLLFLGACIARYCGRTKEDVLRTANLALEMHERELPFSVGLGLAEWEAQKS